MKQEQLNRGNEIQKEIENLKDYIEQALREPDKKNPHLHKSICIVNWNGGWRNAGEYGDKADKCPEFLKEQLHDDIDFIIQRMLLKVNKKIKELENEFDAL